MLVRIAFRTILTLTVLTSCFLAAQIQSTTVAPMPVLTGPPGSGFDVVLNVPLCADLVLTRTQILADGNRIQNTHIEHFCRDSKGRTRREMEPEKSPMGKGTVSIPTTIYDPTANVAITLDPSRHVATKHPIRMMTAPEMPRPANPQTSSTQGPSAADTQSQTALPPNSHPGRDFTETEENLGEDSIRGIVVTGTKRTRTVPAGARGNDLPFSVVSERWYSDEIKLFVLQKEADPRMGETTVEITNIARIEPDPGLFQIPAGFSVEEVKPRPVRSSAQ